MSLSLLHQPALEARESIDSDRAGFARFLLAAFVMLIAYGSLLPFEFDFSGLTLPAVASGLSLFSGDKADVLVNLVLYVPIGALLVFCRTLPRSRAAVLKAGIAVLAISFSLESLQSAIPDRVASVYDVALNTLGGLIGATLTLRYERLAARWLRSVVFALKSRRTRVALWVAIPAVVLLEGLPFDFVSDTKDLREALRHASLGGGSMVLTAAAGQSGSAIFASIVDGVWFALLAHLISLDALGTERRTAHAFVLSFTRVALLVVLIEIMQLFVQSRHFELGAISDRMVWTLAGCWVTVFVFHGASRLPWRSTSRRPIPLLLLLIISAVCAGEAIVSASMPTHVTPAYAGWLPLYSVWQMPVLTGLAQVVATTAGFGLMAYAVSAMVGRLGARCAWSIASLVVVDLALVAESVAVSSHMRPFDSSAPCLALVASLVACKVCDSVRRFDDHSRGIARRRLFELQE